MVVQDGGDKMSSYEIGKDFANMQRELEVMRGLLEQLYGIVEHNLKEGTLKEPPVKKEK